MHLGQYDPDYIVEQRKKNYVIHTIHTYISARNSMAYDMCGECANVYADVCLLCFKRAKCISGRKNCHAMSFNPRTRKMQIWLL